MRFTLNSRDPNPLTLNASEIAYQAMKAQLDKDPNASIVTLIYEGGSAVGWDDESPRAIEENCLVWLAGLAYGLKRGQ